MRLVAASVAGGLAGAALIGSAAEAGPVYDAVKQKQFVQCGVNSTGLPGFASVDDTGTWTGLDIDLCKAVATAIWGDPMKVKYTPLNAKERFTALQSGQVDILSRNTTWTLDRDTAQGLTFTGVNYYDGQGFMVDKELGVSSAKELDGASVCVQAGTTTELNLADYFRSNGMQFEPVVFESNDEVIAAYGGGRCDAITTDASGLYSTRTKLENPDNHIVLPEIISKEPLGPAVRQGDDEWADVVRWSYYAMVQAEEFEITSANIDQVKGETQNPDVKRFLGTADPKGKSLGLPDDFAYQIVKQLGNYGEGFERHVGMGSPLKIARGINALWTAGGLQYAPPFR